MPSVGENVAEIETGIGSPMSELKSEGKQDSPSQNMMGSQFNGAVNLGQSVRENNRRRTREKTEDAEIDSDGAEEEDNSGRRKKKKRYHRHTTYQIHELENFFKDCPHPDEKQRKALGHRLDLDNLQVKFWFQNKRTQMKTQQERVEHMQLKMEHQKLLAENEKLKETISNSSCLNCGNPPSAGELSYDEHHLRMENTRLKTEIEKMTLVATKIAGMAMPWAPPPGVADSVNNGATSNSGGTFMGLDRRVILEIAYGAMQEFTHMAQVGEPLWLPAVLDGTTTYVLNEDEYFRSSYKLPAPRRLGHRWEATRESATVMMDLPHLLEIFMNVNQWESVFCALVGKATELEFRLTGLEGGHDNLVQVMNVEYHMLTPLAPTRETIMARYCRKHAEGIWSVVDVSLEGSHVIPVTGFRKRPSGCLIQQLPTGFSKITWVEHVEVEDRDVSSALRPVINSGAAFGARYWLSLLQARCERLCNSTPPEFPLNDVNNIATSADGRKSMMRLAERMVQGFCRTSSLANNNPWMSVNRSGDDEVKAMTHECTNEEGYPSGSVLNVATSIWLPMTPKTVFDHFCNERSRFKWDILTKGGHIQRMAHIVTAEQPGNGISLLGVHETPLHPNMLILQETFALQTGFFIIYAPIEVPYMTSILDGGDPDAISFLPSGFVILPDGCTGNNPPGAVGPGSGGTVLSMSFQLVVNAVSDPRRQFSTVAVANNIMSSILDRVKGTFGCNPNA